MGLLKNHPNALLIFDTLRSAQTGDENESRSMALVMQTLRQLRDQGATVILLHHTRKGSDSTYKGSTAIFDLVDHVMGLYPVKGPEDDQEVDEDHMENSDRTFRFGTKDKTRFQPFKHFLRFDKESHLFVAADDPGDFTLAQIQKLIPQKESSKKTCCRSLIAAWVLNNEEPLPSCNKEQTVIGLLRRNPSKTLSSTNSFVVLQAL